MSVTTITSSAKDVGKNILNRGTNAVKWGAHKVGDLGVLLKTTAGNIMKLISEFFRNLPHHFSVARTYLGNFVQHIRDNKANSAGIAGIAALITGCALFLIQHLTKEAV